MREKLIELLKESDYAIIDEARPMTLEEREEAFPDTGYESHADFLIANGVTVREKGEWVMRMDKSGWLNYYACSLCGTNLADDDWNFCPNCGADMRGEEHEKID